MRWARRFSRCLPPKGNNGDSTAHFPIYNTLIHPSKSILVVTINEIQDEIIEDFTALDDWMDRYQLLIDLGEEQPALPEADKQDQNLIDGCQSRVWLNATLSPDGTILFEADSDAIIVKGLISLLVRTLSGHTPQEIIDADLYFINEIKLNEHLSPTRSNGLRAMVKQMRLYAIAFDAQSKKD